MVCYTHISGYYKFSETSLVTVYCQLVASETDIMGYTTYVFKNLEDAPFGHKYLMITRMPRWEHREWDLGEIGYVTYNEVIAGVDKWYSPDTGQMIPYNYTNIYFIKFVRKVDSSKKDIILWKINE